MNAEFMTLRVSVDYQELRNLVMQLPAGQLAKLKTELTSEVIEAKFREERSALRALLLRGPVMSEEGYQRVLENRKAFQEWKTS